MDINELINFGHIAPLKRPYHLAQRQMLSSGNDTPANDFIFIDAFITIENVQGEETEVRAIVLSALSIGFASQDELLLIEADIVEIINACWKIKARLKLKGRNRTSEKLGELLDKAKNEYDTSPIATTCAILSVLAACLGAIKEPIKTEVPRKEGETPYIECRVDLPSQISGGREYYIVRHGETLRSIIQERGYAGRDYFLRDLELAVFATYLLNPMVFRNGNPDILLAEKGILLPNKKDLTTVRKVPISPSKCLQRAKEGKLQK